MTGISGANGGGGEVWNRGRGGGGGKLQQVLQDLVHQRMKGGVTIEPELRDKLNSSQVH